MRTAASCIALLSALFVSAQSYYYVLDQGVTEDYYPFGTPGTAILTEPFDDGFSATQTLPFTWDFYGTPVTQFKASDNGYITFDLAATTSESNNTALPSVADPNDCIYAFWDNLELSDNPTFVTNSVRTFTVGTAPDRVFVILWNVTPKGQAGNSNYMYFAARLYEQGDFDLIYQQIRLTTSVSGTAGCENGSGSDATMIAGSPNFSYTGGPYIKENVPVYRFVYGTQPDYDVVFNRLYLDDVAHTSESYDIAGQVINHGAQTISSLTIDYQVDGGTVQTQTINGLSIAPNQSYNFTHPTQWTPANPGTFQNVDVVITGINGNNDANPGNNQLSKNVWVNLGITAVKNVLIEEFSTAPCGFCPDGNLMLQEILNDHPEVIAFTHHSGYQSDAMTIPPSVSIASAFCPGAPLACVDRILWPDEIYVAISRLDWETRALESLADAAPVDIGITTSWNDATREIDVDIALDFVDYVLPGDLRLNVFVIEDSVTGTGSGYDQTNYYNNTIGHYYYNWGDPIVGFVHRHVIRESLTGTWGEATDIPQNAGPDDELQRSFSYTVPPTYKEKDFSVIAFVGYNDVDRWQILNAREQHLQVSPPSVVQPVASNDILVFPNPMTNSATIRLPDARGLVQVRLLDASGKAVWNDNPEGDHVMIDRGNLPAGIYLLEVRTEKALSHTHLAIQ